VILNELPRDNGRSNSGTGLLWTFGQNKMHRSFLTVTETYELSAKLVNQLVFYHMIPGVIKDTIFSPFHHVQKTSVSVFLNHNSIDCTQVLHITKRLARSLV